MIEPTVGRIVWFYQTPPDGEAREAIVTKVWTPRMVNLCVFEHDGTPRPTTSVRLLQDDEAPAGESSWCVWMPYQKGQAAKTEALEKKLA